MLDIVTMAGIHFPTRICVVGKQMSFCIFKKKIQRVINAGRKKISCKPIDFMQEIRAVFETRRKQRALGRSCALGTNSIL